ncbi:hypothetical protein CR513_33527, partial [Mucuna pruriens]
MATRDNGEIESESSNDDEIPPLEDRSDVEVAEPVSGDILVTKRTLSGDMKQCEHNFHTRCHINDKYYHSGENKFAHTRLYKLQWLSNIGEVKVDKKVSIPFAIENYKGEVLCNVVLVEAEHILLGRPWQLDRKVTHNGYTNCLSFIYNELKITLTPLSPKQVCEDQIKMRKVRECEESKEKKNERTKEN